jgi:hypothetical protein
MLARGWQGGFPHSPTIAQITLSSASLSLSLNEVDCFHASWKDTLLKSLRVFYDSKSCLYLTKNKLSRFLSFLRLFYIFITGIL